MKTHTHNTTKFKLVCFYSHKPDRSAYTSIEKSLNRNRKYHDSYDYIHKEAGITVTRHDLAYLKIMEHMDKHWGSIERAILFLNDHTNQREIKIGVWDKANFAKNQLCEPIYDKQGIHVMCLGVQGGGIESYPMRIVNYKPKQFAA